MRKQISLRLEEGVLALVDRRAVERHTSRTEIVEEALIASLGDPLPADRADGRSISGRMPTARAPREPSPPFPVVAKNIAVTPAGELVAAREGEPVVYEEQRPPDEDYEREPFYE